MWVEKSLRMVQMSFCDATAVMEIPRSGSGSVFTVSLPLGGGAGLWTLIIDNDRADMPFLRHPDAYRGDLGLCVGGGAPLGKADNFRCCGVCRYPTIHSSRLAETHLEGYHTQEGVCATALIEALCWGITSENQDKDGRNCDGFCSLPPYPRRRS